jgi:hypothetical protein
LRLVLRRDPAWATGGGLAVDHALFNFSKSTVPGTSAPAIVPNDRQLGERFLQHLLREALLGFHLLPEVCRQHGMKRRA